MEQGETALELRGPRKRYGDVVARRRRLLRGRRGWLVSRQEDVQSTTAPLLVIAIASYIATNTALANPDGGLATIGTSLPPMAPMALRDPADAARRA